MLCFGAGTPPWRGCRRIIIQAMDASIAGATDGTKHKGAGLRRLNGGNSDNGGLAYVNSNDPDNRNDNIGFRALGCISQRNRSCVFLCIKARRNPSAQHFPNLIQLSLQMYVLLIRHGVRIFGQANENFKQIQLHACFRQKSRSFIPPGCIRF